ncbi:hypothetical protein BN1221_00907c [Brenneria goodwinii]|uniref:Uncharacterized protein n=1 Tax=Brenneria goodwinii TaxID=1109412 RepID=A0A0G4JRH1_9GAMM|nr:hypothetical protein BN1221_00907c [Brenneria goodwinii]
MPDGAFPVMVIAVKRRAKGVRRVMRGQIVCCWGRVPL